ncbi:MAG: chemotaxis protein CheD [Candidatus Omnitrophica bacterium]|nr:chemotaxis protein CheD [Candidatus Omnitrophota bacterium]
MKLMPEQASCVVQAGHLAYSRDPAFLFAVCGNGVVVTLRDKVREFGAMAHVVFPRIETGSRPTNFHADTAVRSLVKILCDLGTAGSMHMEAQIFGGGHLNGMGRERAQDVVRKVRRILRELEIKIVSEDVGGVLGRKIVFNTANGETAAVKTTRIRRMDWLPEWEHQIGVRRIAYARGGADGTDS